MQWFVKSSGNEMEKFNSLQSNYFSEFARKVPFHMYELFFNVVFQQDYSKEIPFLPIQSIYFWPDLSPEKTIFSLEVIFFQKLQKQYYEHFSLISIGNHFFWRMKTDGKKLKILQCFCWILKNSKICEYEDFLKSSKCKFIFKLSENINYLSFPNRKPLKLFKQRTTTIQDSYHFIIFDLLKVQKFPPKIKFFIYSLEQSFYLVQKRFSKIFQPVFFEKIFLSLQFKAKILKSGFKSKNNFILKTNTIIFFVQFNHNLWNSARRFLFQYFANKMMEKKQFQTLEFNQNAYESKLMIETLIQEVPVKEKLQEILATLLLESEDNRKEFCKTKLEFETRIKQKDSIIQCLVKINGNLVDENQKLQKKISKSIHQFRQKFIQSKENFSKEKQEMISVIKYLENRNERLLHQIYGQTQKNRKSQGLLSPMRIQTHPGWSVNQNIPFSEKQQKLLGKIDPQSTIFSRCTSSNHLYDLKQNQKSSQKKIFYSKQTTPIIKQQINSPKTNKNTSKLRTYKSSIFSGHRKLVFDNL